MKLITKNEAPAKIIRIFGSVGKQNLPEIGNELSDYKSFKTVIIDMSEVGFVEVGFGQMLEKIRKRDAEGFSRIKIIYPNDYVLFHFQLYGVGGKFVPDETSYSLLQVERITA